MIFIKRGWGYRNRASAKDILKQGLHKKFDNEKVKVYEYNNYNCCGDWINIKVIYNKIEKTKTLIFFNEYLKPFKTDITHLKNLDIISDYIVNIALDEYTIKNRIYKN